MNNESIDCTIYNDGFVKVKEKIGDIETLKTISFESFIEAVNIKGEKFSLPLLPFGIRKIAQCGHTVCIAIEYPGTIIDFNYRGSIYKDIPIPPSVWIHLTKANSEGQYSLIKSHLFSLDMPLLSESQKMYKWPFPNYSRSFGNVCWGNDQNIKDFTKNKGRPLANYTSLYSMYFSASANDDLGWCINLTEEESSVSYNHSGEKYLKAIKGEGSFKENRLKKLDLDDSSFINIFDKILAEGQY